MANNLIQESIAPRSYIEVELSEHCKDAPEFYLRAMLDASASSIAILDESGTILYVNSAWRQLAVRCGLENDLHGVGLNYLEICGQVSGSLAEEAVAITDGITQILLGRRLEFQKEYSCHTLNAQRWGLIHAARFDLPNAFRILVTHDDIVPARQPSVAQEKYEECPPLLLETDALVWEADAESHRFIYVGEQAAKMFGYPIKQWYEPEFWSSHLHPEDRERAVAVCRKYAQTQDNYEFEYRMMAGDGSTLWLQDIVSVTRNDGHPKTIRGFLIDITNRKRTEETLINLSGRLINAQEEERKRIARELHDDLNQRMAILSIELTQLGQKIQKPHYLRTLIESLQTKAQEISAEIHRLSYRLHPSKLDHLGLVATIESLCEELSESPRLKIEFHQTGFPATIPKDVSLCIFRIAQESLRNCIKHSGAQRAVVVLEKTPEALRLSVSDDGCGFDTKSDAMKKGLGFTSMRERLRFVSGEINVYSQPSCGTRIDISVPVAGEAETNQPRLLATNGRKALKL